MKKPRPFTAQESTDSIVDHEDRLGTLEYQRERLALLQRQDRAALRMVAVAVLCLAALALLNRSIRNDVDRRVRRLEELDELERDDAA